MKFFSLVLLVLSFNLYAADPAWIYGEGFKQYQGRNYLTAVGEGSSAEDARKNAVSGLAEQLKVSISSQSNIYKEYKSTAGSSSKKENINVQITTNVNLDNLEGIKIAEQYFQSSSNTYFAYAVLNKLKNATDLTNKIEGEIDQVNAQLAQAKKLISGSRSSEGFSVLSQASQIFKSITADVELHKLFGNSVTNNLLKDNARAVVTKFDEYLGKIYQQVSVVVTNGNQKPGSPEVGVSEPYEVEFSYQNQKLKNVPVKVDSAFQSAVIDHDNTTDRNGMLTVSVRSFAYTDKQQNKINARLGLYDDLFIHPAPKAELIVMLSQKSEVSVQIKSRIKSSTNDYLYLTVIDGLSSVLSDENYNVLTEESDSQMRADYVVDVQGSVVNLPGFNGLHFAKINGVVRISSGKSGRALKTIRIKSDATKSGGLNGEIAAEKATAKLVNAIKSDLLDTLEQNLGRN